MADLPDRETWLGSVRAGLDALPADEADVLAELATHLDDRTADGVARGLDPGEAERRAIARLGDPRTLGRALGRARRSQRRGWSVAGGGAVAFGIFAVGGTALAAVVLAVAVTALGQGLAMVRAPMDASAWPGGYLPLAAIGVGVAWACQGLPAAITRIGGLRYADARRLIAGLAIAIGLPVMLLFPDRGLDDWLGGVSLAIPLLAAAAALAAPRVHELRPGVVLAAVVAAATVLPFVAWPSPAGAAMDPVAQVDFGLVGRPIDAVPGLAPPTLGATAGGTWDAEGGVETQVYYDASLAGTGWTSLSSEVWLVERMPSGAWGATTPLAVAPWVQHGSDLQATITRPAPRHQVWYADVLAGTAPDGVRTVVYAGIGNLTDHWRGSVLDWITGRP